MNLLDKIKIEMAPYLRNTLIGHGNRLGKGALYEGKIENAENTYKLGGKTITLNSQNNQDYFKIVAFVEKVLKREIGGASKTNQSLDNTISEILHVIKYDSFSRGAKFKNLLDSQIKQEAGFKEAKEALARLEGKGEFSKSIESSEVDGLSEVVEYGDFGKLKNEILVKEADIYDFHSGYSSEERAKIEEELKGKKQRGIAMQEKFKNKAREYLKANNDDYKATKQRCKELKEIIDKNPEGSPAYEAATEELRRIAIDKKEMFIKEYKIGKANEEIRDMKRTHEFAPSVENGGTQMGG